MHIYIKKTNSNSAFGTIRTEILGFIFYFFNRMKIKEKYLFESCIVEI